MRRSRVRNRKPDCAWRIALMNNQEVRMNAMKAVAIVAALSGLSAIAAAEELTADQRKQIYDNVIKDHQMPGSPPGFDASKGSELPGSVLLNNFPRAVDDPKVQQYGFAVTGDQVVVADPKTRKIIDVIKK
jgi:hypothetical protein